MNNILRNSIFSVAILGLMAAVVPQRASAAITSYSGQDDGAAVAGPFPNSDDSRSQFLSDAASYGAVHNHDFTDLPLGFHSSPYAWGNGDGIFTLNAPNYGAGLSGINSGSNNSANANLYGFSISSGNWLGVINGSVTFDFFSPTNSFGAYFTGVQGSARYGDILQITFNDGSSETLNPALNLNGGAEYFGFTDTNTFTSLTISRPEGQVTADAWGIDLVSFNSSVPEPATWAMIILGFAAIGFMAHRRNSRVAFRFL